MLMNHSIWLFRQAQSSGDLTLTMTKTSFGSINSWGPDMHCWQIRSLLGRSSQKGLGWVIVLPAFSPWVRGKRGIRKVRRWWPLSWSLGFLLIPCLEVYAQERAGGFLQACLLVLSLSSLPPSLLPSFSPSLIHFLTPLPSISAYDHSLSCQEGSVRGRVRTGAYLG